MRIRRTRICRFKLNHTGTCRRCRRGEYPIKTLPYHGLTSSRDIPLIDDPDEISRIEKFIRVTTAADGSAVLEAVAQMKRAPHRRTLYCRLETFDEVEGSGDAVKAAGTNWGTMVGRYANENVALNHSRFNKYNRGH